MKLFDVFKNMLSLLPESQYSDRRFEADLKLAPAWIEKLILEQIRR